MIGSQTFTPAWLAQEKDPPVFHLRLASMLDRDAFEAELEGTHRAGQVLSFAMLLAAMAGIQALVDEADAAQLTELVRSEFGGGDLSPAEKAQVKEVVDVLAQHWPDYRALVEQEARRNALLPTLAFMRWVDHWDNVKDQAGEALPFERDAKGNIPDDVLRRLPFVTMRAVGLEAYGLQYGKSQAKNSAPLSKSSPPRKRRSTSPVTSTEAGS